MICNYKLIWIINILSYECGFTFVSIPELPQFTLSTTSVQLTCVEQQGCHISWYLYIKMKFLLNIVGICLFKVYITIFLTSHNNTTVVFEKKLCYNMQFLCYFPKRVCMSNIYIYSEVFDPSYQLFASMSMSLKVSSIHETYFAVFLIKNNNIR